MNGMYSWDSVTKKAKIVGSCKSAINDLLESNFGGFT